jgi:hypothetical protein
VDHLQLCLRPHLRRCRCPQRVHCSLNLDLGIVRTFGVRGGREGEREGGREGRWVGERVGGRAGGRDLGLVLQCGRIGGREREGREGAMFP